MAASGTQEHHYAIRRQRGYDQKAYNMKNNPQMQMNRLSHHKNDYQMATSDTQVRPTSTYEHELDSKWRVMGDPPMHDSESVDRQRRYMHRRQMETEYSAKIANRYRNNDYNSQW